MGLIVGIVVLMCAWVAVGIVLAVWVHKRPSKNEDGMYPEGDE